jgi:hypothetical protein
MEGIRLSFPTNAEYCLKDPGTQRGNDSDTLSLLSDASSLYTVRGWRTIVANPRAALSAKAMPLVESPAEIVRVFSASVGVHIRDFLPPTDRILHGR